VNSQCLPFSQIPHTTRLFSDYISNFSKLERFYSATPYGDAWIHDKSSRDRYEPKRREAVAAILERQNRNWGASPKTLENVLRLRNGASVVVTGQQVGLFGGTAFSIYKALTALRLASQATEAGVETVPVFWLATTDHDLAEINHISIPGPQGALKKFTSTSSGIADAPVGSVVLGDEIDALVNVAAELLGDTPVTAALRESYRPGVKLGDAYARLFSRLFADWGLILLDASDPELHAVARPMYRAAIEQSEQLDEALLARGRELERAGYHQQVKVTSTSTLLFTLHQGQRVPIHRKPNGDSAEFLVELERISRAELLRRIDSSPGDFSANVLLRPVVQDYLLPTLAYAGGAAEVAYFAQAEVVYQELLGKATPIFPRFSATLVDPKVEKLLKKYSVGLPDLFHGPERLRETIATKTLPQDLQTALDEANSRIDASLDNVKKRLEKLDPTLLEAASRAGSKMRYQLKRLRARAARAELVRNEILTRHADTLSNALYPNKLLQEREVAGIYFLARYGKELLGQLYETVHTDCLDHQVVSL
jgi:bacillithiol biosynthesis cysteine-adding enzyme BshC